MIARITYLFRPIPGREEAPKSEADYEFVIFGGKRPDNHVGYDLRRWMPMDLSPALRDAEWDLAIGHALRSFCQRWQLTPERA